MPVRKKQVINCECFPKHYDRTKVPPCFHVKIHFGINKSSHKEVVTRSKSVYHCNVLLKSKPNGRACLFLYIISMRTNKGEFVYISYSYMCTPCFCSAAITL